MLAEINGVDALERLYLDEDLPNGATNVTLLPDGSVRYQDHRGKIHTLTARSLFIAQGIEEIVLWSHDIKGPIRWTTRSEKPARLTDMGGGIRLNRILPPYSHDVLLDPSDRVVRYVEPMHGPGQIKIDNPTVIIDANYPFSIAEPINLN